MDEPLPITVTRLTEWACPRCRNVRPAAMFYERRHRNVPTHCRYCQREINARGHKERREIIDKAKLGGCVDCGLRIPEFPEVFDLDHRPGVEKISAVSRLINNGTLAELHAEIAKCDVVCANCHRIRTSTRVPGNFGMNYKGTRP